MAETSIPVDLTNPGHVFACLGFLEAADILLGDAQGGFDWADRAETTVRFSLSAQGHENPVAVVLEFLSVAEIKITVPKGWRPNKEPKKHDMQQAESGSQEEVAEFPSGSPDTASAMPIRLVGQRLPEGIVLSHWADGSSRNDFKLYSGNRSAFGIASRMLQGKQDIPRKGQNRGDMLTKGVAQLWEECREELVFQPFGTLTAMGGSFNFDPCCSWTAIGIGYSPDNQGHQVAGSPVVEVLAALGLQNSRPEVLERNRIRYSVWSTMFPIMLARVAMAGGLKTPHRRRFVFDLGLSGKNKIVTFAQEE